MNDFRRVQARLEAARSANTADSTTRHTVVVLPSFTSASGVYNENRGRPKYYVSSDNPVVSSDNLVDERWTGLSDREIIAALDSSAIDFEPSSRTGAVPHILSCRAIDGRFGFSAIGDSPDQAEELYQATRTAVEAIPVPKS